MTTYKWKQFGNLNLIVLYRLFPQILSINLPALLESDSKNIPQGGLSRYQRIKQIRQHFWSSWHKKYYVLVSSERIKWFKVLLFIKEDNLLPLLVLRSQWEHLSSKTHHQSSSIHLFCVGLVQLILGLSHPKIFCQIVPGSYCSIMKIHQPSPIF